MITDKETRLCKAQAVTTSTEYSDFAYDTADGSDINGSGALILYVNVGTAFTGGTSLDVKYVNSASADLTSLVVLASTGAIVEASLTAGARLLRLRVPANTLRYVGLQFVTVGTHSTGTINAGLVRDADTNRVYSAETGF